MNMLDIHWLAIVTADGKTNMASGFAKNISEAEISQIIDGAVPENTKKSTQFGLNVFRGKF